MEFHQRLGQDGPARRFLEIENRRLLHGLDMHEIIQGLNVETYAVRTDGNAVQVLQESAVLDFQKSPGGFQMAVLAP